MIICMVTWEATIAIVTLKFKFVYCTADGSEQLCLVDSLVWAYLMEQAQDPQPYYSPTFEEDATYLLRSQYSIERSDITCDNIKQIYRVLIDNMY